VSRRTAMEMAALRLCAPEIDPQPAAVLRRLDALEAAVRAGRAAGAPVESAAKPAPTATAPEPVPADIPAASAAPAEPAKAAPAVPAKAASPTPAAPPADAETPFAEWPDIVETLATASPPLYGVLRGTSAVLRGDGVLIETDSELFKSLVRRDGNMKVLQEAIRAATGRVCRIFTKKAAALAPGAGGTEDNPLDAFVRSSRELGVDLKIT